MSRPTTPPRGPDRAAALAQYRRRAAVYDLELAVLNPIRRRALATLALCPGDVVLDAACGTGLSFEMLRQGVGTKGRIVGIEQSPEMIDRARQRVKQHRWRNVTLVCSPVETADVALRADAALFFFTHDVLRRPEAVENILCKLRPGARVVAAGLKWAAPRLSPTNLLVLPAALHSVTSLEGMSKPWSRLGRRLTGFEVQSTLMGGAYLASGVWPG